MGETGSAMAAEGLFHRWFAASGVSGSLGIFPSIPSDLAASCRELARLGAAGIGFPPLPAEKAEFADNLMGDAVSAGQIDTLTIGADGAFTGSYCLGEALRSMFRSARGRDVSKVLLAGDAAAGRSLASGGFAPEMVLLTDQITAGIDYPPEVVITDFASYRKHLARADLLLNSLAESDAALDGLGPSCIVADFPLNVDAAPVSALLRRARARGHCVWTGLDLLAAVSAARFAKWFGVVPDKAMKV
ncbi:hypothetical protein FACS1894186_3910 [Alphaproteobacteria bacterium]|nr:hypothetical protein FACS1894186_3910 [Alphaproteobacteria bacterium]